MLVRVAELAGHRQPVLPVEVDQLGVLGVRRPEVGELEAETLILDTLAQDVERASAVQLRHQPLLELDLRVVGLASVPNDQLVPLFDLSGPDEGEQLGRVERLAHVVVLIDARQVSARHSERLDDVGFKLLLRYVHRHQATPASASIPSVTAAVIRACRCSPRSSICLVKAPSSSMRCASLCWTSTAKAPCVSGGGVGIGSRLRSAIFKVLNVLPTARTDASPCTRRVSDRVDQPTSIDVASGGDSGGALCEVGCRQRFWYSNHGTDRRSHRDDEIARMNPCSSIRLIDFSTRTAKLRGHQPLDIPGLDVGNAIGHLWASLHDSVDNWPSGVHQTMQRDIDRILATAQERLQPGLEPFSVEIDEPRLLEDEVIDPLHLGGCRGLRSVVVGLGGGGGSGWRVWLYGPSGFVPVVVGIGPVLSHRLRA